MFLQQKKLPAPQWVKGVLPIDEQLKLNKQRFDEQFRQNLQDKKRFVVACGPCSADDPVAVADYLERLKTASEKCPNLLVVARIYTTKPRSNGLGYKGLAFGADGNDLCDGILQCRRIMIDCLKLGLPIADELLYPELYCYFDDLVTYWFVGARSSEDSLHRAFASGLDLCCGIKNATDGDVDKLCQSVYATTLPTVFPFGEYQVATNGNKFCHAVLRGGSGNGKYFNNISSKDILRLKVLLARHNLNDFIMADLGHANSGKVAQNQIDNAKMAVGDANVNGVMVESYLYGGQSSCNYGVSKTDDCLGWEDTENLLNFLQEKFSQR